jgi:hypothetical protein
LAQKLLLFCQCVLRRLWRCSSAPAGRNSEAPFRW